MLLFCQHCLFFPAPAVTGQWVCPAQNPDPNLRMPQHDAAAAAAAAAGAASPGSSSSSGGSDGVITRLDLTLDQVSALLRVMISKDWKRFS